jgi:hypothetical protein
VFDRVLGARHLVQGLLLIRRPTHSCALIGASIDAAHAASMLLLARMSPAWRRLALANAALAAGLSLCGLRCSGGVTSKRGRGA